MLPIATATSHLAVRRNEVTMLTTMQMNRHVIDLTTDLFLVSFMIFYLTLIAILIFLDPYCNFKKEHTMGEAIDISSFFTFVFRKK